jgi:hypothetical protein
MNQLLQILNASNSPQRIPIKAEKYSTPDSCFFNVQDKVSIDKGELIYGWKLHQTEFIAEAERHAVWRSPEGELIDITPDSIKAESILFIEDNTNWEYNGQFTDNIRVNLTGNSLIDDFILLSETITKLWQTGRRKSRDEVEIINKVHDIILLLEKDKIERLHFISSGNTRESKCYCGRLEKYKNCHGLDLKNVYSEISRRVGEI